MVDGAKQTVPGPAPRARHRADKRLAAAGIARAGRVATPRAVEMHPSPGAVPAAPKANGRAIPLEEEFKAF